MPSATLAACYVLPRKMGDMAVRSEQDHVYRSNSYWKPISFNQIRS